MEVLGIIVEDMVNYRKISCTLMMPYCDFKCNYECGKNVCHNYKLMKQSKVNITADEFLRFYYLQNPITEAIVFQGLEPLYNPEVLFDFIDDIRKQTSDDIVIYTGYTEEECEKAGYIDYLKRYENIYIKFGRYIPNRASTLDEVIQVSLASDNQYAKKIS